MKANKIRLNLPDSLPKENATGRVEVYHNNQWGTVCDKAWDRNDAFVVCNELGLVKAIHETKNAKYGQGEGPIWLSNVDCSGGESSLFNCPHPGWGNVGSCKHSSDAGVKCLQTGKNRFWYVTQADSWLPCLKQLYLTVVSISTFPILPKHKTKPENKGSILAFFIIIFFENRDLRNISRN